MIFLLLDFGFSIGYESEMYKFSIKSPFSTKNPSEVGTWSLQGDSFLMKDFIRLTDKIPGRKGGICQRVPTTFKDWTIEIETNSYAGANTTILFIYSKEFCPSVNTKITGYGALMNMSSSDMNFISIYEAETNKSVLKFPRVKNHCQFPTKQTRESNGLIKIYKINDSITFETGRHDDTYHEICRSKNITHNNIDKGYFTIISFNGDNPADNTDLFRIFVRPQQGNDKYTEHSIDYDSLNRKILEDDYMLRTEQKKKRRSKMNTMMEFITEMQANDWILTKTNNSDIRHAFKLVNEAVWRINQSMSSKELDLYLNGTIDKKINMIEKRLEFAQDRFYFYKDKMKLIWDFIEKELEAIREETDKNMKLIKADTMKYADIITTRTYGEESPLFKSAYAAALGETKNLETSFILQAICIFELFLIVLFVAYRGHKTHGYTKAD